MGCKVCTTGRGNLKLPAKYATFGVVQKQIFVPLYKADGTRNSIDLTALPNAAAITALINQTDDQLRWAVSPQLENIESVRGDATFNEFASGRKAFVKKGVKPFSGIVSNVDHSWYKQVEKENCIRQLGVYQTDECGNVRVDAQDADSLGLVYPLPIEPNTFDNLLIDATDSTESQVAIRFDFASTLKDEDMGMIIASDFASDVNFLLLEDLLQVDGVAGAATTTEFTFDVFSLFGSVIGGTAVEGLLLADIEVYNQTTAAVVTLDTVVENSAGNYTAAYSAGVTASNVLEPRVIADGYEDSLLRTRTATAA